MSEKDIYKMFAFTVRKSSRARSQKMKLKWLRCIFELRRLEWRILTFKQWIKRNHYRDSKGMDEIINSVEATWRDNLPEELSALRAEVND